MTNPLPAGHGFIAGRGRPIARKVFEAVAAVEGDEYSVKTTDGGYTAPLDVVAKYEELNGLESSTSTDAGPGTTEGEGTPAEPTGAEEPKRSASTEAWATWAKDHKGYDPAEDLSRAELIERFGEKE